MGWGQSGYYYSSACGRRKRFMLTMKENLKPRSKKSLTGQPMMLASQSQWEWFHSGCSDSTTYRKKRNLQSSLPQKHPQKMTRGKIHSQCGQRCEHPNLSGNGSTQAVRRQIPTANRSPTRVNCRRNHHPKKEDTRQNTLTDSSKM